MSHFAERQPFGSDAPVSCGQRLKKFPWTRCLELKRKAGQVLGGLLVFSFLAGTVAIPDGHAVEDENERFKTVEVRVIRPRYFNKRKRIELGAQFNGVMNEAFIYTFLASGLAAYHFTETFAVEAYASLGYNFEKEDKRILFDEFKIKTKIFQTFYALGADIQWTPIYGKWQFGSGRLIYFDTYATFGAGMTGINWAYKKFCTEPDLAKNANAAPLKSDQVKSYPTIVAGVGQRYFVSKDTAFRWDIRNHALMYEKADAECSSDPTVGESGGGVHNNITLQLGASKFF